MQDAEVIREPLDLEEEHKEIDELFAIRNTATPDQLESCEIVQKACRLLAHVITKHVPEGKERTIAVNNILSAALMARHGITKKPVAVVSCSIPSNESSEEPPAAGI